MTLSIIQVTEFEPEHIYWDKGTGSHSDVSFWRSIPPDGAYMLGDYGQNSYAVPTGAVISVRDTGGDMTRLGPALMPPEGYRLIWSDAGSGGDEDGALWHPLAPPGYYALGTVVTRGHGRPNLSNLRCVRGDLVRRCTFGDRIWTDAGSGATSDLSCWGYVLMDEETPGVLSGSFWAHSTHDHPSTRANAWCLKAV